LESVIFPDTVTVTERSAAVGLPSENRTRTPSFSPADVGLDSTRIWTSNTDRVITVDGI
jgi:hypothetical protein